MRWMFVAVALPMMPALAMAQNYTIPSAQAEARHQDPTDPITPIQAPPQYGAHPAMSAPAGRVMPDPGHTDPTDYTAGQSRPSVGPNVP